MAGATGAPDRARQPARPDNLARPDNRARPDHLGRRDGLAPPDDDLGRIADVDSRWHGEPTEHLRHAEGGRLPGGGVAQRGKRRGVAR
ncbi:hypothetical protein NKG94_28200 [Micromonospora sp. M12]